MGGDDTAIDRALSRIRILYRHSLAPSISIYFSTFLFTAIFLCSRSSCCLLDDTGHMCRIRMDSDAYVVLGWS